MFLNSHYEQITKLIGKIREIELFQICAMSKLGKNREIGVFQICAMSKLLN